LKRGIPIFSQYGKSYIGIVPAKVVLAFAENFQINQGTRDGGILG
jgi:hypothetical protein